MRIRQPVVRPDHPLLLSVEQAAALAGIGVSTMRRLVRRGDVPSVVLGRSLRLVPRSALEVWAESLWKESK